MKQCIRLVTLAFVALSVGCMHTPRSETDQAGKAESVLKPGMVRHHLTLNLSGGQSQYWCKLYLKEMTLRGSGYDERDVFDGEVLFNADQQPMRLVSQSPVDGEYLAFELEMPEGGVGQMRYELVLERGPGGSREPVAVFVGEVDRGIFSEISLERATAWRRP